MSELSFLIELLLNHKLQKSTRDMIAERIKEVEASRVPGMAAFVPQPSFPGLVNPVIGPSANPALAGQSPSTQAALARHPDLVAQMTRAAAPSISPVAQPPAQPVAIVAQTPATAQAMADRQQMIEDSIRGGAFTGKPEKGRSGPRKF
jgi:hypothetical protein